MSKLNPTTSENHSYDVLVSIPPNGDSAALVDAARKQFGLSQQAADSLLQGLTEYSNIKIKSNIDHTKATEIQARFREIGFHTELKFHLRIRAIIT